MYNQTEKVNIRPKSYLPVFRVSEGDVGRTLTAHLVSDDGDVTIPAGATVTMAGTKPSGLGYTVAGTVDGSDVSFDTDAVMTDEPGRIVSEIRIVQGDTLIGTTNVVLSVEPNPHPDDTTDGRREPLVNEITALLTQITEQADRVEEYSGKVLNMTVTAHESDEATVTKTEGEVVNLDFGLPRGPQGPQGIPGEDGVTPDFTIGTVETLAPGEQATATITGTDEDPVLNLGIPQGAKGDKGDPGDVNADGYYPDLYAGGLTTDKGTVDKTPYLFRASPSLGYDYNRESGVIVGGTVAWNQMLPTISTEGWEGENSSSISVSGTTIDATFSSGSPTVYLPAARPKSVLFFIAGHKYLGSVKFKSTKAGYPYYRSNAFGASFPFSKALTEAGAWKTYETVAVAVQSAEGRGYFGQGNAADIGLTYDDVVSFKDMMFIDLTQFFGTTIADYIYNLEQSSAGAGVAWFKRYFPEDYYPYSANTLQSVQATAHKTYDGDGNVIGNYALDSSVTLRGIPKLDASNNLYYDGDTYASDGTVTRKWGFYTIQASDITFDDGGGYTNVVCARIQNLPDMLKSNLKQAIHSKYGVSQIVWPFDDTSNIGKFANNPATQAYWFIFPVGTTIEQMRTALSGTTVVYELATPTTETADPYTNPQVVDPDGTEEYVTANYVPVGHETLYIEDLKAKLEDLPAIPEAPSTNGTYTLKAVRSASGVTYSWVSG